MSRARIRAGKAAPGLLQSPSRMVRVVARTLCNPDEINTTDQTKLKYSNVNGVITPPRSAGKLSIRPLRASRASRRMVPRALVVRFRQMACRQSVPGAVFEFIFPENTGRGDPIVPSATSGT